MGTLPAMPIGDAGAGAARAGDGAWLSGYDGAQRNPTRGEVFFPDLDTRYELDAFTREELLRRIRWLYTNTGLVGGVVDNGADLIGYHRASVLNEDPDYVLRANEVIEERMGTPELFDRDGNFNFEDSQPMLSRLMLKDGDAIIVRSRGKDGGALFAFYESHQLCDPPHSSSKWRDGVRYEGGKRVAYGLRDGDTGKVKVIEAKNVIYYGELKSPGHGRAVPRLARAVNHSIDITEVFGFLKAALKSTSLFGAVIQNKTDSVPAGLSGMGGTRDTVKDPVTGAKIDISRVFGPGQIPELAKGREMKVITDDRPSPEAMAFVRELIRDVAQGFGLPPEVLWHMVDLTGPGVRFVMDLADRWIGNRQKPQRSYAKRAIFEVLACEIEMGRLEISAKDPKWWGLKLVAQRSLTIDRGQVSRAMLDEIDAGVGTWEGWEKIDGMGWQDRFDQRAREVAYGKRTAVEIGKEYGVELSYEEVIKPRQGAATAPGKSGDTGGKGDEEEEKEKGKGAK